MPACCNFPPSYQSISIGEATNNTAELRALHEASSAALRMAPLGPASVPVYFFIDSIITIKIGLGYIKSSSHPVLANAIILNISQLSQTNPVYIIWVPAHADVTGNEIADFLAKRGAEGTTSDMIPPERFLISAKAKGLDN